MVDMVLDQYCIVVMQDCIIPTSVQTYFCREVGDSH